jgi:AcrR family transcriptional regulator
MAESADRSSPAKGAKTRQAILDAAEELFGEQHYDAISLRDVAQKAEVLLGLVSYHFKSKEKLFEEVAIRWSEEANAVRLATLRQYQNPSVEQVVDAFIRPSLEMCFRPDRRNYWRVIHQVQHSERWRPLNNRLFYASGREFYEALQRAMPGVSEPAVARGFLYTLVALLGSSLDNFKYEDLTGDESPLKVDDVLDTLVPYAAGGLRALAQADFANREPAKPVKAGGKTARPKRPAARASNIITLPKP